MTDHEHSRNNPPSKKVRDWTDDLSVGIDVFDEEHRCLISLVKILAEASPKNDHGWHVILESLVVIDHYLSQHFTHEEASMASSNYPHREEHVREHRNFYFPFKGLILQCQNGLKSAFDGIPEHISDWHIGHIVNHDQHYKGRVKPIALPRPSPTWRILSNQWLLAKGDLFPESRGGS